METTKITADMLTDTSRIWTVEELETLGVNPELREIARARGLGDGTWRANAKKADLIGSIISGMAIITAPKVVPVVPVSPSTPSSIEWLAGLAQAVAPFIPAPKSAGVDADTLQAAVDAAIANQPPKVVHVLRNDDPPVVLDRQHYLFEMVMRLVSLRQNVYLVGPAGSGKTKLAENVAHALGLEFHSMSVCAQTSKFELMGYMDAHGQYVPSIFYTAVKNGGVVLLDEVDAGNANVLSVINALSSNGECGFPNGEQVKKHGDFVLIAAANTYGTGADRKYVGRNALDGATLDRFAFLEFPIDEGLEAAMCGINGVRSPAFDMSLGGSQADASWVFEVQNFRESVATCGLQVVVSPRASKMGCAMLAAGIGLTHVRKMVLYKGLDKASIQKCGGVV